MCSGNNGNLIKKAKRNKVKQKKARGVSPCTISEYTKYMFVKLTVPRLRLIIKVANAKLTELINVKKSNQYAARFVFEPVPNNKIIVNMGTKDNSKKKKKEYKSFDIKTPTKLYSTNTKAINQRLAKLALCSRRTVKCNNTTTNTVIIINKAAILVI